MVSKKWVLPPAALFLGLACSGSDGKAGAKGPQGEDGTPGVPGEAGKDGKDGAPGKDGDAGPEGPPGPLLPPPAIHSLFPSEASVQTILTIAGENFDPQASEVWVDGRRATLLSASATQLRVTGFPAVDAAHTAAVTVVSKKQASNAHNLRLVPAGHVEFARDRYQTLVEPVASLLLDDTPGKERLLILDRTRGIFEFGREPLTFGRRHAAARDWPAIAFTHSPADGHLHVAYELPGGEGFEIVRITPEGEAETVFFTWEKISSMAFDPAGRLLLGSAERCKLLVYRGVVFEEELSPLCIDKDDPITFLLPTEERLFASGGGANRAVMVYKWDEIEEAVLMIAMTEKPGVIARDGDGFVVSVGSKLVRWDNVAATTSLASHSGVRGLHLVDDGVLVVDETRWRRVRRLDDFHGMTSKDLIRHGPFYSASWAGTQPHFVMEGALWHLQDDGSIRRVYDDEYVETTVSLPGGDLLLATTDANLLRYAPADGSAKLVFKGFDHDFTTLWGVVEHGGELFFTVWDEDEGAAALAVTDLGGSNLRKHHFPFFATAYLSSDGERICHTTWEDGIACFDPALPWEGDGTPGGWARLPGSNGYLWDPTFTSSGALYALDGKALVGFDDGLQILRMPAPFEITTILGEDASGRLLVAITSDDGTEQAFAYVYR